MEIVLYFLLSVILGIPAIIASLLLTSRFMGGVELGPVGTVVWKCALLLVLTQLFLSVVPAYPLILFVVAVWWLGYYFVIVLDAKEARNAAFITFLLLLPVYLCT